MSEEDSDSREEVVYAARQGPRSCHIFCNWCTETFTYREQEGHTHENTTCPWCKSLLKIPRNKLRQINGVHPGMPVR